jgi:tRNA(Ile)-lysidine synthase
MVAPPTPHPETALGARFQAHLHESGLILPGDSVLVALSGGVDSVVLLQLLRLLPESWGLRLAAAHLDHGMRAGSREDAEWVSGLCRAWEVPLEVARAGTRLRGQAAARAERYRFLRATAERLGMDRIATAHHADDQAETVLFRLIRGAGLQGLAGIPSRRGPIVRPLLPFTRAEIEDYVELLGVPHREDPSNLSLDYARNHLRLEVLPRLEQIAPGATRSLTRLARAAGEDAEAWESVLDTLEPAVVVAASHNDIELARPPLLSYHPRIRGLLLRRFLGHLGSHPGREGTQAVMEFISSGASGGEIHIAGGVRIRREFDRFHLWRVVGEEGFQVADRLLEIAGPGRGSGELVLGNDRHFDILWMLDGAGESASGAAFDPAELRFPLEVRGWRPGDRIQLSYGTKKLKKLFAEHRVGRRDRERIPIVAEAEGRVLWVVGIARATGLEPEAGGPRFHLMIRDIVTDTES